MKERHGMRYTPEYTSWKEMKRRCYNPNFKGNYIEKGIVVCEQWRTSFTQFYKDVGPRPAPGYTIDRKDNNGNYEPGNVRWATKSQQSTNRGIPKGNKSGIKGVHFCNTYKKWKASIRVDGKRISLGSHNTLEEAKAARIAFGSTL